MAKRILTIDTEECIACGNCEKICPEVFRFDEAAGHSEIIDPEGAPLDDILDAVDECPVKCIHFQEE